MTDCKVYTAVLWACSRAYREAMQQPTRRSDYHRPIRMEGT